MLEKGCRVALGVDGKALDEDDDGLRELRLAHLLHVGTGFKVAASREQMLKIAFANGRFAVTNMDDGGAIAPGAPADLLLLDWAAIDDDGLRDDLDPIELLLGRATLQHVRELIVAGRTVVKDGKILGADLPAARAQVLARDARRHESRRTARRRDARARSRDGAAFRTARALLLKDALMPVARVHRISAAAPDDVSGIEAAVNARRDRSARRHRRSRKDRRQWLRQRFHARLCDAFAQPVVSRVMSRKNRRIRFAS